MRRWRRSSGCRWVQAVRRRHRPLRPLVRRLGWCRTRRPHRSLSEQRQLSVQRRARLPPACIRKLSGAQQRFRRAVTWSAARQWYACCPSAHLGCHWRAGWQPCASAHSFRGDNVGRVSEWRADFSVFRPQDNTINRPAPSRPGVAVPAAFFGYLRCYISNLHAPVPLFFELL